MGFFNFFNPQRMSREIEECLSSGGIVLDVRSADEYSSGHIPHSINLPLASVYDIDSVAPDKDAPLCLYCHSGARSAQAASILRSKGYSRVKNLGGILSYSGELEY